MPPPLSALQKKFAAQLSGGHFRQLNEKLYTQPGAASLEMMKASPALFDEYHKGYREQVRAWPSNPLDNIIAEIQKATPRGKVRVADFGCGDARLASALTAHAASVHSFDLVARAPGVIACDMARVPLAAGVVDVAVFCLSLMG